MAEPEAELRREVRRLCAERGITCVVLHHSFTGGVPDLLIAGTAVLFRELKSASGRVMPAQRRMHEVLRRAGADVAVWRPAGLADGTIAAELDRIRPR